MMISHNIISIPSFGANLAYSKSQSRPFHSHLLEVNPASMCTNAHKIHCHQNVVNTYLSPRDPLEDFPPLLR